MHLDRNARAFQREIPRKCVLNADAVILRLNQERGRNIRIDFEFRRKIQLQFRKIRAPAEKPIAPTLSGMMSNFSAFARIMRIARAASA